MRGSEGERYREMERDGGKESERKRGIEAYGEILAKRKSSI